MSHKTTGNIEEDDAIDITNEELIKEYFSIVMKFDEYGSSPSFTNTIQEHIQINCKKLEQQKENGEQSINNYLLFQQYSEMMEKNLAEFIKQLNINPEKFIEACQFAREENVPCAFLDYVLSSIEFEDFYFLMLDYKKMQCNGLKEDMIIKECQKDK